MVTSISNARTAAERLKRQARALGFDAVGIASAREDWPAATRLEEFLALGRHGDMDWLSSPVHGGGGSREARDGGGETPPLSQLR